MELGLTGAIALLDVAEVLKVVLVVLLVVVGIKFALLLALKVKIAILDNAKTVLFSMDHGVHALVVVDHGEDTGVKFVLIHLLLLGLLFNVPQKNMITILAILIIATITCELEDIGLGKFVDLLTSPIKLAH